MHVPARTYICRLFEKLGCAQVADDVLGTFQALSGGQQAFMCMLKLALSRDSYCVESRRAACAAAEDRQRALVSITLGIIW